MDLKLRIQVEGRYIVVGVSHYLIIFSHLAISLYFQSLLIISLFIVPKEKQGHVLTLSLQSSSISATVKGWDDQLLYTFVTTLFQIIISSGYYSTPSLI